ncbi:MAG: hypothetical protein ABSE51_06870 [Terracidiphilus sp.]
MCSRVLYAVFALTFLGPSVTSQQAPTPHTTIELNLQPGLNDITTTQVTAQLEPDSVVLRDLATRSATFHIIEQNYDSGVATPEKLLKPTLRWQIQSDKTQDLHAELAYITGGLNWQVAYNAIMPEATDVNGDQRADILAWVTVSNQSGTDFPAAHIKLMAADAGKIQSEDFRSTRRMMTPDNPGNIESEEMAIGQRSFDDFHFYDLNRTVHLRDAEVKQVQFLNATGVSISRSYVYDGASANRRPLNAGRVIEEQEYGLDATRTRVNIAEEIRNTSANHLGIPLPCGRLRLYRRGSDGGIEFVSESLIPHTPPEGSVSIVSGDAFDLRGARTQTDFYISESGRTLDETIQIKLANQKPELIAVTVLEHLYRGNNCEFSATMHNNKIRASHGELAMPNTVDAASAGRPAPPAVAAVT